MRRELAQRRASETKRRPDAFDEAIYFDVQHSANGDAGCPLPGLRYWDG